MTGSRHALIIANDTYQDQGLGRLTSPAEDAAALAEVLGDPRIGNFEVHVLRNEPSHVISMRIDDFFSERRADDALIAHFSCHGLKSESGELFFAAANTLPRRLGSTAVSADFVRRCMSTSRARSIVLLLDCCYGGAFAQGANVRAAGDIDVLGSFSREKLGGGRGRAVITASNSMEYAFEGTQLTDDSRPRPSVFTSALVNGLATGDADLDEDGRISLDELYEYVFDRVHEQNPNQTPSRSVDLQGDLYVARSQRRRIKSSPIPVDTRAAMSDPDIYKRRGAIAELRSRMENTDLEIAAGARDALAEMARNDIQSVAEEANRALREAAINPYPRGLDFGRVSQNSPSPHQSVRLLGPPLARSCVPHPKADWLNVTDTPDGLDVSVDTSQSGSLSGDIVLKGAVGESVVHVDAEVLPKPVAPVPSPPAQPPPSHSPSPRPPPPRPLPARTPPARTPPEPEERARPEEEHAVTPPTVGRPGPRAERVRLAKMRAPVMAVCAAVLAVTSAIMAGLAVASTVDTIKIIASTAERGTPVSDVVGEASDPISDALTFSIVSALTAIAAFVLARISEHEIRSSSGRYSDRGIRLTKPLAGAAKALARPVIVVAVILVIASFVATVIMG